jgi:hypothetical protein
MTSFPSVPNDYDSRSKDPESWYSVGYSLYFAAATLWKKLRPALMTWEAKLAVTEEQERALRLRGPYAMLSGMAIEVILKGAIVEAMPPGERIAPPKGHKLLVLSEKAGVKLNHEEADLLSRLTTFVEWGGRYPVATTSKKTAEPRILKSSDFTKIVGISSRIYRLHSKAPF